MVTLYMAHMIKKAHNLADAQHGNESPLPDTDNLVHGDEGERGGDGYHDKVEGKFDVVQFPPRLFLNSQQQPLGGLWQQICPQIEDYAQGDDDHACRHERNPQPIGFGRGERQEAVGNGNKQTEQQRHGDLQKVDGMKFFSQYRQLNQHVAGVHARRHQPVINIKNPACHKRDGVDRGNAQIGLHRHRHPQREHKVSQQIQQQAPHEPGAAAF